MFKVFDGYPGLVSSLSVKGDGQMKMGGDQAQDRTALANRRRFFDALGIEESQIVCANLAHGKRVLSVNHQDRGRTMVKTDGLVSAERNLFLSLTVADCLPVFLYDPAKGTLGLVHAGWKGLEKGILAAAIERFKNSLKGNILVGIGPGIGPCHFEVQNDVREKFRGFWGEALVGRDGKTFLDLKKIAFQQLLSLGLKGENIEISSECTFCLENKYFSARRDKPLKIEAMVTVIGLRA